MTEFAELCATSHYSFLRGASSPANMVMQALALGMTGIGIADRNSVAGVVRAHVALREARETAKEEGQELPPFRLIVGARLCFTDDTPDIIAYPRSRAGWGRLTRLLTTGNLRAEKGDCILFASDLAEFIDAEMALIILPQLNRDCPYLMKRFTQLTALTPHIWIGAVMPRGGADRRHLAGLKQQADDAGIPLLATNTPLFAHPDARPLHDILTCISEQTTIAEAGRLLNKNAEAHLKMPEEMVRLFTDYPDSIVQTQRLLSVIDFTLDELSYHYPDEPVPKGWSPQDWLSHLVWQAAHTAYPDELPGRLSDKLAEELSLIGRLDYAPYFLTVYDIVRFARSQGILCQGRGSAANSAVCYMLGITSVDPVEHDLLFSRFISEERREPPDIDVDFEHERREEVIQYIYDRYGRHRAAIAATVVHYRSRSAIREVGKALGLSEDITSRLSSTVWGSYSSRDPQKRFRETGLKIDSPEIERLGHLVQQILQFPRHLSQHVGGFILTQDRLDETVPVHNAAMEDRTFIEWDKDDIDALGLMKVDVLALGMLTCIRKAFAMMEDVGIRADSATNGADAEQPCLMPEKRAHWTLQNIPKEDPETYRMLQRGDSIGVFQVESRAQMSMLPRLKPKEFYDLVIQVAIVRPGPIEGEMVHPYLRRRSGEEAVTFPSPALPHDPDELRGVLGRTCGVPLFQEQAMKLAIVAAGFSSSDANKLRRAMATFRNVGTIHHFEEKMINGMLERGYDREFAERCFKQIQGFGSYGFPESHAQSFAILVYISSWIKCHYPAVFAAALLNSQPMGFYAPAQIIRDAREHGVMVHGADVNHSGWDSHVERGDNGDLTLRIGLHQVDGFREEWAARILTGRRSTQRLFSSVEELSRDAGLPRRALTLLADADALSSLAMDRRDALWQVRRMPSGSLPLFEAADARELAAEADMHLPQMTKAEHVTTDYLTTRLSLKGHPMEFLRGGFNDVGVLRCGDIKTARNSSHADVAGVVLIRQRPGKGNAIFVTLEDESGVANILIWARLFERYRRVVMSARLMKVRGEIQKSKEGVIHIIANHVEDCTAQLDQLLEVDQAVRHADEVTASDPSAATSQLTPMPAKRGHPRNVRILPKSRDFH